MLWQSLHDLASPHHSHLFRLFQSSFCKLSASIGTPPPPWCRDLQLSAAVRDKTLNILCHLKITSSNRKTVKLWNCLKQLKNKNTPLALDQQRSAALMCYYCHPGLFGGWVWVFPQDSADRSCPQEEKAFLFTTHMHTQSPYTVITLEQPSLHSHSFPTRCPLTQVFS